MGSNNYHGSSERAIARIGNGKYEAHAMTLLASRVDALAQKLNRVGTSLASGGSSLGPSVEVYAIYETCGVQGHASVEYYNGSPSMDHANAMHTFNTSTLQNNACPNANSSRWKSYSNPPHKNHNPQPQNAMQPPGFQYRVPYNLPL